MCILLVGENFFTEHEFYRELKAAGFSIDRVGYDSQVFSTARFYDYDLIIIRMDNPNQLFFSAIRSFRSFDEKIPMIVVSQEQDPTIKVQAFQAGIDDYVMMPFDTAELIARCRAVLRRNDKVVDKTMMQVDGLQINLKTHEVFVNQSSVHLTCKEYLILEMLILRCGVLISKTALLNHLYSSSADEPDIKIIDVFVCKLRKKLQQAGAADLISTMWGRGYIFRTPTLYIKDDTNNISKKTIVA